MPKLIFLNNTPLHEASLNGHVHIVKILLENNADIDSKGMNS